MTDNLATGGCEISYSDIAEYLCSCVAWISCVWQKLGFFLISWGRHYWELPDHNRCRYKTIAYIGIQAQ